ncbi:MAG: DUF3727 domain-containing protein [Oscillatoriales cyanobacterium RM2_1_1]|nr:DUF3727 domain-containing protein [Oscillatoriales cyanobacterium SM2_3_0]NJO44139.1 DUF3727 domain-containing protein [Oscillatoriales cyanobacterium RM2_1_1]
MTYSSSSANGSQQSPETILTLTDEQGRSLDCLVQSSIQVDAQEYALLIPSDTPVELLTWPDEDATDEEAIFIDSESEVDEIFPIAKAVLEEQNLILKRTAITLTVEGELPEPSEEEAELELGEESEAPETEEMLWLASFYHEEREYGIYVPLDPFFLLVKIDSEGKPYLLSGEELEKLEPFLAEIEDQLFDDM